MVAVIQREDVHAKPRALVVDDSRIARYVLYGLLDRLGFEVDLADSAELAVRQLGKELPDVVFMDHLLPGIDGLECVRRLRAQPRSAKLPIVMYTSQDTDAFAGQAKDAGADDVFFKTGETKKLNEILRRLDLLPEKPHAAETKVVTIPRRLAREVERADQSAHDATSGELLRSLEPLVQAQHEKLRQDLLAEFVILERHEERMRGDLLARLDELLRASNERLDEAVTAGGREVAGQRSRARGWRRYALAASCLLMLTAGLVAGLTMQPGGLEARAGGEKADTALGAQAAALSELRESVERLQAQAAASLNDRTAFFGEVPSAAAVVPPDAATALITELQSMGILGQVRIETSAGAFCVRSGADGFALEPAGSGLQDCEVLPVYTVGLLQ
ncbi:response regulator [Lentisalinibacter sediminis]|uniref:response regulator n=1 Tax=Lentisalinibacter sediminis TaxID=2992237 RepID=UPI00386A1886